MEGNNTTSNWWAMEHAPGSPMVEPSGDAADHFHRYPEDMRLLADAGLNSYRFSVEWARIEPERGFVSRAMLDHYRRMIDTARENGLDPTVTLMHFTVPQWFQKDGFWRADDAVDLFARYVETVLPILDGIDYVCTINEPNIAAMLAGERTRRIWSPTASRTPTSRWPTRCSMRTTVPPRSCTRYQE